MKSRLHKILDTLGNEVSFKRGTGSSAAYLAGFLYDISEVKSCMERLADSLKEQNAHEHFYRSVLDSLPQRLFWKDRNSVFRGCNLNGARALNLSDPREIIGKTDSDFYVDHDEADYLRLSDERVMDSGQASYHTETPAGREGGWLDVTKVPLRDEKGEVYGLLISYEDVGALKKSEMALMQSEARLREITDTIGEGIYVTDENDIITFVNPAAVRLLKSNKRDVLWSNAREALRCRGSDGEQIPGDMPSCLFDEIRRTHKVVRCEKENFVRKDGCVFPASVIAAPILRNGNYAGMVVAFHDITERYFTQKLLNNTLQELRTILDNAQIGVAYLRGKNFFWINKHMEQMFGYAVDDLQDKPMDAIYADGESICDDGADGICDLLRGGMPYESERLMKRSSGETFWCHQRGVAVDPDDPSRGSIWIMLDIDRLKRTESNLKLLNETLNRRVAEETQKALERERLFIQQGRNAAMGEMIGNIAHQWRQPLSTLGLVVQNIQADYLEHAMSESVLHDYVETANRAIRRMSCTIDDFRDFFRPNRAKERFSIDQSIQETLQLLDATLKNNGIVFSLTGNRGLEAWGYPNEFSQAMLNFVVNAKDELLENKVPHGRIDIEVAESDGCGVVAVRDNAGGIQEEDMAKIFDPYFTTKPSGTGIGLYMSKIIIERHMGGRIACRNITGGAEFTISVPLACSVETIKNCEVENA